MRVAIKLGKDLDALLAPHYAGTPPAAPAPGSSRWITPGSNVTGGDALATSWASQFLGTVGTDVVFSKLTDGEGEWQRVQLVNGNAWSATKGIYTHQTDRAAFSPGDRCIATVRIRAPDGSNLNGIGISIQCIGASTPWAFPAISPGASYPSPIGSYDATISSDPFTIPLGTTQIWFLINPSSGSGSFEFQRAGIFKLD